MAHRPAEVRKQRSTGRRSSGTDSSEGGRTPTLKKSVSFASTTTVKTFETLPWHLNQSDDSASNASLNGTRSSSSEDEVFEPRSFLLEGVNNPQTSRTNGVDRDGQNKPSQYDWQQQQVCIKEQDKTILFSELNDSDCAMEITTNVSQLSSSFLNNSFESERNRNHQNLNHSVVNDINADDGIRVPWIKETDHEIEKTRIFLSNDENNMEMTRNITSFVPSLSQRFLKAEYQVEEEIFFNQENFPSFMPTEKNNEDSFTDMEMTGLVDFVPKRRSVLMDLTEINDNGRTLDRSNSNSADLNVNDIENLEIYPSTTNTQYKEEKESINPIHSKEENLPIKNPGNGLCFSDQAKKTDENTVFIADMEVTECVPTVSSDLRENIFGDEKTVYDCNMELSQTVSLNVPVSKSGNNSDLAQNTMYLGNMELTSCVSSIKSIYHNSIKTNSELNENTMFTQDMNLSANLTFSAEISLIAKEGKHIGNPANLVEEMVPIPDILKSNDTSQQSSSQQVENINHVKVDPNESLKAELSGCEPAESDCNNVLEKVKLPSISSIHNAFGSEDLGLNLSGLNEDVNDLDTLHDSISLSEIAGLDSPKIQSGQKMTCADISGGGHENFLNNSSVKRTEEKPLKNPPHETALNSSQRISMNNSLYSITGAFQEGTLDSSLKNDAVSVISSFANKKEEERAITDTARSFAEEQKNDHLQMSQVITVQDRKKAALRKSLCNEMLFPNMTGEKSYTKGIFSSKKSHTTEVMMTSRLSSSSEVPSTSTNKDSINTFKPEDVSRQECVQDKPSDTMAKSHRFSTDFFGDGEDLLDEECPSLEDAYDQIPLNESLKEDEEELAFSYMRSILEAPVDKVPEKEDNTDEVLSKDLEFSDICQVMGLTLDELPIQEGVVKPVSNSSLSDKLDACLFTKPEVAALELYVQQLQEECSRNQQMSQENLERFRQNPPKTYTSTRNARRNGLDISSTEMKVQDMAKACQNSARGKLNRHKANYLMHLTCAQQAEHEQQKKDLNEIMSDIERIANISNEIDKCMEDLDAVCVTQREIQDTRKRTEAVESDTLRLKSQCENLDKEIQRFNKTAKDSLHKIKDDKDEEVLLLDTLSCMACLSEWSLLNDGKNRLTFGFLFNTIIMTVKLFDGKFPNQRIADISFASKLSSKCRPWARVSHQLMFSTLNRDALRNKYEDFTQLNQLLSQLSDLASNSRELCCELKSIHLKHQLTVDGLKIKITLFSFEHQQKIELHTTFKPGLYPMHCLTWKADVLQGSNSSISIVDVLNKVKPGASYITRSLNAVLHLVLR